MDSKTALQILNVLVLGLSGAVSGKLINEWRTSREERHKAELASLAAKAEAREAANERLKATDQIEIQKRDLQIATLSADNERLKQTRSERMELLEEQVRVLKSQAPAGVAADFDGLKKVYENKLLICQAEMEKSHSLRSDELSRYQADLSSKETIIEQLKANRGRSWSPVESDICLQSILLDFQRKTLERGQQTPLSRPELSEDQLIERLKGKWWFDLLLMPIGFFLGGQILQYTTASNELSEIGDPVVPRLEGLLSETRESVRLRAAITLRRMKTEKADEALNRHNMGRKQ